jgi:primosomal protein N' (replication factor Y) (superfamily II helicase)
VRRWLNAAALVRGAPDGGKVVLVAAGELRPVQAMLRWQPWWHTERETEDRAALHLPPAARLAAVTGTPTAVRSLVDDLALPAGAEVLGPVAVPGRHAGEDDLERLLVRVPRAAGMQLADLLRQAAAARSARKATDAVRIELDPQQIG